jgi:hypothetical protein
MKAVYVGIVRLGSRKRKSNSPPSNGVEGELDYVSKKDREKSYL